MGASADPTCRAHAAQVLSLFEASCVACHRGGSINFGGLGEILDADYLRSKVSTTGRRLVDVESPEESVLYAKLASGSMPLNGKPFDAAKLAEVRGWIACGAPPLVPFADADAPADGTHDFLGYDHVYARIASDLRAAGPERAHYRYIALTHLRDAGSSDEQMEAYTQAVTLLLNSLSWSADLLRPEFIDEERTVLRFSLDDLASADSGDPVRFWDRVLRAYPYGLKYDHKDAPFVARTLATDIPFVRGDWFATRAATPPLYEALLELPGTAERLEQLLGVDAAANIEGGAVVRAGFQDSGVSVSNRVIERHETPFGAYWKSYDFKSDAERRNIFRFPLGPGTRNAAFLHDGGELIFNLPNGLQGYLLVDAAGKRIDKGPTDIVQDPARPDSAVVNGLSCMVCHGLGLIPKQDEVREFVEASAGNLDDEEVRRTLALYVSQEDFQQALDSDLERFQSALRAISVDPRTLETHPLRQLVESYEEELDGGRVAAELGLEAETLRTLLGGQASLLRTVGTLATGGSIRREAFEALYRDIVCTLGRGTFIAPTSVVTNPGGCGGEIEADELRESVADARCDWYRRCAGAELECGSGFLEDVLVAVETGETIVEPKQLSRCVEDLRTASCDTTLILNPLLMPSCKSAFLSNRQLGEPCVSDVSCATGSVCRPDTIPFPNPGAALEHMCSATCVPRSSFCLNDNQCNAEQLCVQGICQNAAQLGRSGEPCIDAGRPDFAFRQCEGELTCMHEQCLPLGRIGEPCQFSWNCRFGLACTTHFGADPEASGECVAPPEPAGTGEACTELAGCADDGDYCDPESWSCLPLPSSGPCIANQARGCAPATSYCDTDAVCRPARQAGQTCTPSEGPPSTSGDCLSGFECRPDRTGLYRCLGPFQCD